MLPQSRVWGRKQLIEFADRVCQGCVALRTGENVRAFRELLSSGTNSLLSKEELSNEEICLRDHNTIKVNNTTELLDSNWNSGGAIGKISFPIATESKT